MLDKPRHICHISEIFTLHETNATKENASTEYKHDRELVLSTRKCHEKFVTSPMQTLSKEDVEAILSSASKKLHIPLLDCTSPKGVKFMKRQEQKRRVLGKENLLARFTEVEKSVGKVL